MPSRLSVDDAVVQDAIMAVLRATDHAIEIPQNVMRDTLETAFAAYNAKFASPSPSSIPAPAGGATPTLTQDIAALNKFAREHCLERDLLCRFEHDALSRVIRAARLAVEAQQDRERLGKIERHLISEGYADYDEYLSDCAFLRVLAGRGDADDPSLAARAERPTGDANG